MSTHAPTGTPVSTYTGSAVHLGIETELGMARQALAKAEQESIHDDEAMIRTSVSLSIRLAALLAALDEEERQ
ncbi:hypothetical protein ABTX35_01910 [Streptomyces sp. NPDC096080]|uniref:hypothetical protein n=1 Tax=Streptomyces sp. NPDC096080 TaxID=3156693 RepID=UPI003330B4DC